MSIAVLSDSKGLRCLFVPMETPKPVVATHRSGDPKDPVLTRRLPSRRPRRAAPSACLARTKRKPRICPFGKKMSAFSETSRSRVREFSARCLWFFLTFATASTNS
jgi:hypothetical protein